MNTRPKILVICAFSLGLLARLLAGDSASAMFDGKDAPLKGKSADKKVIVVDAEGSPVAGVKVVVEYDSVAEPPSFTTDAFGIATVKVDGGFWAIRSEFSGNSITVRGDIEWPLVVILPIKAERRANQAAEPTAIIPPPSATSPAPLAHL